jgi:hypothetical protein
VAKVGVDCGGVMNDDDVKMGKKCWSRNIMEADDRKKKTSHLDLRHYIISYSIIVIEKKWIYNLTRSK